MTPLQRKSALITGANGFLGGAIKNKLLHENVRVVSAVWPAIPELTNNPDIVTIDLMDGKSFEKLNSYGQFDAIIHCAALLPGVASEKDILFANQEMTYNLLDWSVRNNASQFIFASTCRLYGMQPYPCVETSPLAPPDMYAISKVACELLIKGMMSAKSIPWSILRISAPYGPGSKANTVIRKFLMDSSKGIPLKLLGSGNRSQDFVYETDVARAFHRVFESRVEGVFNLSGGASISMKELAEAILEIYGLNPETHLLFSGEDLQESYRGNFPIDAATRSFGYLPQTTIREGLRETAISWNLL